MEAPLIFTSARRIARRLKRAVAGCTGKRNSRLNVVSKLVNQCARESRAAGKTIHQARESRGRKLIAGSFRAIHARINITAATKARIKMARRCGFLRTNIANPIFTCSLVPREVTPGLSRCRHRSAILHTGLRAPLIERSRSRTCLTRPYEIDAGNYAGSAGAGTMDSAAPPA